MHPTNYRRCWHVVCWCLFFPPYGGTKEVYNPKAFILHAASLRQAFAHCARFLVAATRRCMGRIAVPLWLTDLSVQLPVVALVSHYLTNKLIGRRLLSRWEVIPFTRPLAKKIRISKFEFACSKDETMVYYLTFRLAIHLLEVDSHALLTRLPLIHRSGLARLAYLKHAASVHPELGSNSQ